MYEILSVYLENGLKVVLHKANFSGIVGCGLWVNQGSKHETDEIAGISHFIEHLLVDKHNVHKKQLADLFDEIISKGVYYNAATTKEDTSFYFTGLSNYLKLMINTLFEIVNSNMEFSTESFEREKNVVEREAISFYSSFNQIKERTSQALYGNYDIGRVIMGSTENIASFTKDNIKSTISESYTPENSTIVICGDFDYEVALDTIYEKFAKWNDKDTRKYSESIDANPGVYFNGDVNCENAVLSLGFRLPRLNIVQSASMSLISTILADPVMSTRIPYRIRHQEGLAYNVGSFVNIYENRGTFGISTVCKPSNVVDSLQIMVDELQTFISGEITELELERAQNAIQTKRMLSLHDISKHLLFLGKHASKGKSYSLENEIRTINKVNIDGLRQFSKEVLIGKNIGLALIGNCDLDQVLSVVSEF